MNLISDGAQQERSHIISMSELFVREGAEFKNSMNFRDKPGLLSVVVILPREGEYTDRWDPEGALLICEGHDSIAEGAAGSADDQLLMYTSGKPTENGKFYKAAQAYKDGLRDAPLQVQIYEKLDQGVFFDKGIFNLVDASYSKGRAGVRKVARFHLSPADADDRDRSWDERMIAASAKAAVWVAASGRCAVCTGESGLHFKQDAKGRTSLLCALHENSTQESAIIEL
jgi:hypothetical protein